MILWPTAGPRRTALALALVMCAGADLRAGTVAPAPPAATSAPSTTAPIVQTPASPPARPPLEISPAIPSRPAPLLQGAPDGAASNASALWLAESGRDALQAGLPLLARNALRMALSQNGLDAATRDTLLLDLAAASLALGDTADVAQALNQVADKSSPLYLLRASLVEARLAGASPSGAQEHWASAATLLARIEPEQLSVSDRPWYYFVSGLLAEQRRDSAAARAAWITARDLAATPAQGAQFAAELWRAELAAGEATPQLVETLRQQAAAAEGRPEGRVFAMQYIIALDQIGRRPEAVSQALLLLNSIPDADRTGKDGARLLFALLEARDALRPADQRVFADPDLDRRSRDALQAILEPGGNRATQEIALALLSTQRQLARDPDGLRAALERLTAANPPHALLDRLYLLQAQLALSQNRAEAASAAAQKLFDQFPGSPWRDSALRLLAYTAWSGKRPADAADYVNQLRVLLPQGPERARMDALLADLYFESGDFVSAADSYRALLADERPPAPRGVLLWRAVQSQIRAAAATPNPRDQAAQLDKAAALLDAELSVEAGDSLDRWRAEWNLLTALRDTGRETDALVRLDKLLKPGAGTAVLPPDLRLRLAWLSVRLAVDARRADALDRTSALQREIAALSPADRAVLGAAVADQLAASALLLQGQAAYHAGRRADFRRNFDDLRARFARTDAAASSIFFEASALAAEGKTAEAQDLLAKLAEDHPDSEYAPAALYQAALFAEQRTQYDVALAKLATLAERSSRDARYEALLYQVLLHQGDIQRLRNNFPSALEIYRGIVDRYPNDPRNARAEMAIADCLAKQAAEEPVDPARPGAGPRRAEARAAFARLVDLPSLPADARVEAGFKYADFLARQGDIEGAQLVFWRMISTYLPPDGAADIGRQGEGGYWLARCVFELADIYEKQNRPEEARRLYQLALDRKLPGEEEAAQRLNKRPAPPVSAPAAAPPPASATARGTIL